MKVNTKYFLIGAAIVGLLAILYYRSTRPRRHGSPAHEGFNSGPSMTLYYASWCPHCKNVQPAYDDWVKGKSNTLSINGKSVKLNNSIEEKDIPAGVSIKGFPTILYTGVDGKPVEVQADRSPSGWENWLKQNA